jgi:salicylate hydroxylase
LLDACDSTLKSALYEREPLPQWSQGTVTLLGDACHPMLPFMAQGAGMAIEDAVVLGRALAGVSDRVQAARALQAYENTRKERTARIQIGSRGNQWMKGQGNADWVYGYDAWSVPLASA